MKELGYNNVSPQILSDSGNLILHLDPYEIVAKVALYDSATPLIKTQLQKELNITNYLVNKGAKVVTANTSISDAPMEIGGHWVTFWNLIEKNNDVVLTEEVAMESLVGLTYALSSYEGELPILGVWKRVHKSANRLRSNNDYRIQKLIKQYDILDKEMYSFNSIDLVPSHGDSHIKNLYPTKNGWVWMDFEDASLMPKYWDYASFLANITLFNGLNIRIVKDIIENKDIIKCKKHFLKMLKSRVLMSIVGNLDLALQGLGDLEFAELQLSKYENLINEINE